MNAVTLRTNSGRIVRPLAMRSRDLDIDDIAHALSNVCRYMGNCPEFYSVAQHSVIVANMMIFEGHTKEACLGGLLHDAAEYVLGDMFTGMKNHPLMAWYKEIEHETSRMILANYGVDPNLLSVIKPYDTKVLRAEKRTWSGEETLIIPISPSKAKRVFLSFYRTLSS